MKGLGFMERQVVKGLGWKVRHMESVRRWVPLIGTFVLFVAVLLRLFGQEDLARVVEQVGALMGITASPTVPIAELLAATAAVTGVVMKVNAEIKKARGVAPQKDSPGR